VKFIEMYIPGGRKNRPGRAMTPRYITVHDTGNTKVGADASAHAAYLAVNKDAEKNLVSWHLTVDDVDVYQSLPFNECGYHAGDGAGPGNRQSIGMELCMNIDGDRTKAEAKGAAAIAQLIRDVPTLLPFPECVVQHNHWSGKNCPQILRARPHGWELFLASIEARMKPSDAITVYAAGKLLPNGRIIDGITYVPARAVGEALGARVTWEPKKRVVRIERK
jgi:N-acetylmuramoyl-L-alanine amidase